MLFHTDLGEYHYYARVHLDFKPGARQISPFFPMASSSLLDCSLTAGKLDGVKFYTSAKSVG